MIIRWIKQGFAAVVRMLRGSSRAAGQDAMDLGNMPSDQERQIVQSQTQKSDAKLMKEAISSSPLGSPIEDDIEARTDNPRRLLRELPPTRVPPVASCATEGSAASPEMPPFTRWAEMPPVGITTDNELSAPPTPQQEAAQPKGPPIETSQLVVGANGNRGDRRAAVDAYIDEVFSKTGKRITRTDIWKSAGYRSRTEFERWERQDRRATKTANQHFTRILTEKPHLK